MFSRAIGVRRALLGVGASAVLALFAGCGSEDSTSATTADSSGDSSGGATIETPTGLAQDGELTVCVDPSYPPLESFDENGEYTGFDIGVARGVAEKLGLEATFQETAFSGILPALDSGRCDLAWSGLFIDPERTATFSAVPYQETASVIMVQDGNPDGITSPEDLAGKVVASQNGSNLLEKAEEISKENEADGLDPSNVQGYDKFQEAVQQLAVGRADAVITQDLDAEARKASQPGQFETAYTFPDAETFGVYYKPDNPGLGEAVYEALIQLEEDGELEAIATENQMPVDGIAVGGPIEAKQG